MLILAYDWWLLPSPQPARRLRAWLIFAPSTLALVLAASYRLSAASGPLSIERPLLNLWTQAIVIWRYLALVFLPVGQSIMHGVHRVASPGDVRAIVAVAGLVLLLGAAATWRRRLPLLSFGIVWFLAVIAPSSSIVALREGMAEHRAYLASAGVFMALAGVLSSGRVIALRRQPHWPHVAVAAALIALLGALTVARNAVWSSPVALWREATVHAAGMWEPHYALGDALRESGDCEAAVVEYQAVVRVRPQHRDAFTNLGICLAQTGRVVDAEAAFRRALDIDPAFARGYTNLGALAVMSGQPERARDFYHRALETEPQNVLARMQLARLYETVFRDFHAAARMCGEARALAPLTPNVTDCVERNQRLAAAESAR
jgi:tetratricopeptide (TPR) repeat protein